jgi:chromatin segregation and condensation protein Rec8/ScpA/Scc1 (kleisin family)
MVSTEEEFQNIVRRTLEYQEARALLLELAELEEERARIRSERKKLRTFFPEVIRLAKSDVRHSSENDPDGFIAHCSKAAIECDLHLRSLEN